MKTLAILLVLFLATPARAQTTYTWSGSDGAWFTASDWSPSGIPGDGETALITSGSPNLTRHTTVTDVEFSSGSLSGDGNLTVTGTFTWFGGTLNGRDYTETAVLTIPAAATLLITGEADKVLRVSDVARGGDEIFDLAEAGPVRLVVYDVLGPAVAVLVDEERAAGRYEVGFDGRGLAAGLYLVRLHAGPLAMTRRLVLSH